MFFESALNKAATIRVLTIGTALLLCGCPQRAPVNPPAPVPEQFGTAREVSDEEFSKLTELLEDEPHQPEGSDFCIRLPQNWTSTPVQKKSRFPVSITREGDPWNLSVEVFGVDEEFNYDNSVAWIDWKMQSLQNYHQLSTRPFWFQGLEGRKMVARYTESIDPTAPPVNVVAAIYILSVDESAFIVTATSIPAEFDRFAPLFDACASTLTLAPME